MVWTWLGGGKPQSLPALGEYQPDYNSEIRKQHEKLAQLEADSTATVAAGLFPLRIIQQPDLVKVLQVGEGGKLLV